MPSSLLVLTAIIGLAAEPEPGEKKPPIDRPKLITEVKRDQTADQVRKLLGKPDRVSRQILFRKHIEQWVYDGPEPIRVEFLCLPAEEARVQNVYLGGKRLTR